MSKNAVVVEDFKLIAAVWEEILIAMGYTVTVFNNGENIVEPILQLEPEVVLMDINLPRDKNGLEISRELIQSNSSIRIMAITMQDQPHYLVKAKEIGLKGYVLKNASIATIKEAIKAVADGGEHFSEMPAI
jgi:two-component system NarL family response regulator/two-component system response regulator DegU